MICSCLSSGDADCPCFPTYPTYPRARVPHVCCECGEQIPVGASYERWSGLYAGRWETHKTCDACRHVRDDHDCGEGWIWGELWEDLRECYGGEVVSGDFSDDDPDDPADVALDPWSPPPTCGGATYRSHRWTRDGGMWRCTDCGTAFTPYEKGGCDDDQRASHGLLG